MTIREIAQACKGWPFTLRLKDGRSFTIGEPGMLAFTPEIGQSVAVATGDTFTIIGLGEIEGIERITSPKICRAANTTLQGLVLESIPIPSSNISKV